MNPIRVIVVDDSSFMRKMVKEILESDSRIEVIATARNGEEGLNKIGNLHPDVVTMDLNMPIMDGFTALEILMEKQPLPVVMLASVSEEDKDRTIEAMSKGAVDFIQKPSGSISLNIETIKEIIISKIINASKIRFCTNKNEWNQKNSLKTIHKKKIHAKTVVVIGSSTGGPRALHQFFTDLPSNMNAPIFVVQHMPAGFTKSLANRLNRITTKMEVKEAEDGEIVKNNTAYIAPGGYHLTVKGTSSQLRVKLTSDKPRNNHRPCVDVLFESVAELNVNKIAIILTGMGNDGSHGIKYMKQNDANTTVIAESEETAVVYGMPKSAISTNFVDYIEPISNIGNRVADVLSQCNK